MAPGRSTYLALFIVWSIGLLPASAQTTGTGCSELYVIDLDNHGTVDLATAKKSGTALIHENNPEFLKVVEERFKAADADKDYYTWQASRDLDPFRLHTAELTGQTDRVDAQSRQARFQDVFLDASVTIA